MRSFGDLAPTLGLAVAPSVPAAPERVIADCSFSAEGGCHAPEDMLRAMAGFREGISRIWCGPGKTGDESRVAGTPRPFLEGWFVRHEYIGTMH